ncbi:MAG: hypothetical protein J0H63_00740, partial [Rhizobiales bacterium]|nr:hypothetical protein [Hyphomicrobiales bacterium]
MEYFDTGGIEMEGCPPACPAHSEASPAPPERPGRRGGGTALLEIEDHAVIARLDALRQLALQRLVVE